VDLINFVFPPSIVADPAICIVQAILSPFNTFVEEFNSTILHTVPGESHCYVSSDSIEDSEDGMDEGVFSDPEFLNSLQEPGIPPHELVLKVGAICRLTRNFDASRGLTKNTRVIVRNLLRHTVEVETISAVIAGKVIDPVSPTMLMLYAYIERYQIRLHIPRISCHFQPHSFEFKVLRKQIPLALCYATTFNGCQGLTVQKLGLDLRREVFSHGQLYSAMTRVPDSRNVLILKYEGDSSMYMYY
jgi:ATP-dependent DNA helicase PIF1